MFQPRQHHLLTRLLDFTGQKHLVKDGIHLVKVEDQVQFTHISKEGIQHLDEEVDSFQEGQLVIVGIDASAEEETGVSSIDNLVVAKLDKVGLVFLVPRGDEAVDFALELDLLLVAVGSVPFRETGLAPEFLVLAFFV